MYSGRILTRHSEGKKIRGTNDRDRLFGNGDSDSRVYGNDDRDYINGMAGNDALYGGAGDDTLIAGKGFDVLVGGSGNDTLVGGGGLNILEGGDGDDYFLIQNHDRHISKNNLFLEAGRDIVSWKDRYHESKHIVEIFDFNPKEDKIVFNGNMDDYQLLEKSGTRHGTEITANNAKGDGLGTVFIQHQLDMNLNGDYFVFADTALP